MNKLRFANSLYEQAKQDISDWGYRRSLDDYEQPTLVRVGNDVAWIWYEWLDGLSVAMHVCANPLYRGHCFTKHVNEGFRWIPEVMGADRVYTLASQDSAVVSYVKRLGWQQDELGWYLDV